MASVQCLAVKGALRDAGSDAEPLAKSAKVVALTFADGQVIRTKTGLTQTAAGRHPPGAHKVAVVAELVVRGGWHHQRTRKNERQTAVHGVSSETAQARRARRARRGTRGYQSKASLQPFGCTPTEHLTPHPFKAGALAHPPTHARRRHTHASETEGGVLLSPLAPSRTAISNNTVAAGLRSILRPGGRARRMQGSGPKPRSHGRREDLRRRWTDSMALGQSARRAALAHVCGTRA